MRQDILFENDISNLKNLLKKKDIINGRIL